MFITKKHLPRRAVLQGALGAVSLPFLSAMVPAFAEAPKSPQRFLGIFVPHGAAPGYWIPQGPTLDVLPYNYQGFEKVKDKMTITSGVWSESCDNPPGVTGADHFVAAGFFSGVKPVKTTGSGICGPTIDQVIAKVHGQNSLIPSMQIALEDPGSGSSNCGEGYSCVYTNCMSWTDPWSPNPMELNPVILYERMFGQGATKEIQITNRLRDQSILDSIMEKTKQMQKTLPQHDNDRIDQYFTNVREVERRIGIALEKTDLDVEVEKPTGIPNNFHDHFNIMADLISIAFQSDISRVGTMLMARDLTGRTYPMSEVPNLGFHSASHHGEDPRMIRDLSKINRYHNDMVASLCNRLNELEEGDGKLLDNSLIMYGTNMGNPNQHLHYDTPLVFVGGAGKNLKGNRHLAFEKKTVTNCDILVDVLNLFDVPDNTFLYERKLEAVDRHEKIIFDGKKFGDSTRETTGLI